MAAVAVDTHAIVWYLGSDSRLSARAAAALDFATENGDPIHIPSICLIELNLSSRKWAATEDRAGSGCRVGRSRNTLLLGAP